MNFKRSLSYIVIAVALVTTTSVLIILSGTNSFNVFSRGLSLNVEKPRQNGYNGIFTEEVMIDNKWVKQRQELIEAAAPADTGSAINSHQAPRKVTRLLIVAYMRGGSTLFGELFNHLPKGSLYWFEPVDAFYVSRYGIKPLGVPLAQLSYVVEDSQTAAYVRRQQHENWQLQQQQYEQSSERQNNSGESQVYPYLVERILNADELAELTDFLFDTFSCEFRRLPLEAFVHGFHSHSSFMTPTYTCLKRSRTVDNVDRCSKEVAAWCDGNAHYHRPKIVLAEQRHCFEVIKHFRKNALTVLTDEIVDVLNSTVPGAFLDRHNDEDKHTAVSNRKSQVGSPRSKALSLPPRSGASMFFNRFKCLNRLKETSYEKCIGPTEKKCHNDVSLITLKIIRIRFADIEPLLKRIPDIHVIHLLRDPRAVVLSRVDSELAIMQRERGVYKSKLTESTAAAMYAESKHLCRRMLSDLRARRRLENRYPGAITAIRYEDLIVNPRQKVSEVFRKIGLAEPDEKYFKWLQDIMFARKNGAAFDVNRANATATAEMWKHRLSYRQAVEINQYCWRVLEELGYRG